VQFARDVFGNATQAWFAAFFFSLIDVFAADWERAFSRDDNGEVALAPPTVVDFAGDGLEVKRDFGQQDHICAASDTSEQGNPSGEASHQLDDHHAFVRSGGRVQLINRFSCGVDRSPEAKGQLGRSQIVVNRFRHADDRYAKLGQP